MKSLEEFSIFRGTSDFLENFDSIWNSPYGITRRYFKGISRGTPDGILWSQEKLQSKFLTGFLKEPLDKLLFKSPEERLMKSRKKLTVKYKMGLLVDFLKKLLYEFLVQSLEVFLVKLLMHEKLLLDTLKIFLEEYFEEFFEESLVYLLKKSVKDLRDLKVWTVRSVDNSFKCTVIMTQITYLQLPQLIIWSPKPNPRYIP